MEIKVIGVGGAGCNVVNYMIDNHVDGVEFICANTDAEALKNVNGGTVVHLGKHLTKGLDARANHEMGRQSAIEDRENISEMLENAHMVFVIAGMGGGTGTGAAPVIAEIAKDMGILTVAVVSRPFRFEGKKRSSIAEEGIKKLSGYVDLLITIDNEKIIRTLGGNTSLLEYFNTVNEAQLEVVQGVSSLIVRAGMINVDFADIRTVMSGMGQAAAGTGRAAGKGRARIATEEAVNSLLLEGVDLQDALGILVSITAGEDMSLDEFSDAADIVGEHASDSATMVVGTVIDPDMYGDLRVTIVATGLDKPDGRMTALAKVTDNMPSTEVEPTLATDSDYLDIPAFLRRQVDDIPLKREESYSRGLSIVAPEETSDKELAELIKHLSNVYRSVGGDSLVVGDVKRLPPSSNGARQQKKFGAVR